MDKSLKERVLETIDIVELVGESVSLKRKGKDFVGLCPFHDDHTPSMAVSPTKQIFKCWSCGAGGDAIKFVQLRQRIDFREALAVLARRLGLEYRRDTQDTAAAGERDELRRVLAWARTFFRRNLLESPDGAGALEYARRRGMTDETIARFQLGFARNSWDDLTSSAERAGIRRELLIHSGLVAVKEESDRVYDRFRNRLIFPICDVQSRVVAFGGRALGDDPAKYLNSPETPLFSKSRVLYSMDLARPAIERSREVVVVEGYVDAVMMHQAGFENTVATLGTALTDTHAKSLTTIADRVLMCFDSDEAGQRAADRAVEAALKHKSDVRVVSMPGAKDPADFIIAHGADELKSLLQSAIGALEFKWQSTWKAFSDGSPQAKREAVERFLEFVGGVAAGGGLDPLGQGLLVGRLSDLLGLPTESVYGMLASARARVRRPTAAPDGGDADESAYAERVASQPPALVRAAEEYFGALLSCPESFEELRNCGLALGEQNELWHQMFALCERTWEHEGTYSRRSIVAMCDDAALLELVSRAAAPAAPRVASSEDARAIVERANRELELIRGRQLRHDLRSPGTESGGDDAFRALMDVARRQQHALSVDQRGDGIGSVRV